MDRDLIGEVKENEEWYPWHQPHYLTEDKETTKEAWTQFKERKYNTRDDVIQADRGVSDWDHTTVEDLTSFRLHYMCYPVTAYARGKASVVNPNLINKISHHMICDRAKPCFSAPLTSPTFSRYQ